MIFEVKNVDIIFWFIIINDSLNISIFETFCKKIEDLTYIML